MPGQPEFKVEHFVKPSFAGAVSTEKTKAGLGDTISFDIKASCFCGAAAHNAKADWFPCKVLPKRNDHSYYWGDDGEGPAPEFMENGQLDLDQNGQTVSADFKAADEGL